MILCCYYPNPRGVGITPQDFAKVTALNAFVVEVILPGLLMMTLLAVRDERSSQRPQSNLGPLFVGPTVAFIVGTSAQVSMAAKNPTRDFGGRLFPFLVDFGPIAIPGACGNEWWLYVLAPSLGAVPGAGAYDGLVRTCSPKPSAQVGE